MAPAPMSMLAWLLLRLIGGLIGGTIDKLSDDSVVLNTRALHEACSPSIGLE